MQRKPGFTGGDEVTQRVLLVFGWDQIAGVGNKHIGLADGFEVVIVTGHLDPNVLMLGQEFQQFQPRVIHIVIIAGNNHVNVDDRLSLCFRHTPAPPVGYR